jgi:hypothetical protein
VNLPRSTSERLIFIRYSDFVNLLDIAGGPTGTTQDALITPIVKFMFVFAATGVIPFGKNRVPLV